jgi:predicted RNA-binding Zn ribbon-like protein
VFAAVGHGGQATAAEAGCIGLFLDTSKNRGRRWCSMDACGVEAKVQRQATRRRAARTDR